MVNVSRTASWKRSRAHQERKFVGILTISHKSHKNRSILHNFDNLMASDTIPVAGNWLMDDDVNLFDSLACLLEDEGMEDNDAMSDLDTISGPARPATSTSIKQEKTGKGIKKRKFNPDSDIIAAATDETLKTLELDPNSKEGKQKRRQIRNRLSAQFHRDRKNAHINTLEDDLTRKDQEINALREQISLLVAENEYLRKLNPGAVFNQTNANRTHAVSLGSYPESSTHNTDAEDGESVQSMMFYLNGGATGSGIPLGNAHISSTASNYSGSSLTASPHSSPFHTNMEASLPGVTVTPQQTLQPRVQNGTAGQGQGQGQGLLIPTGLSRPLSLVAMVCMVSLMLLSGQQGGPSMGMVPYPAGGFNNQEAALTVGSELLALMHTAGAHLVETRTNNDRFGAHQRRLTEDSGSDSEDSSVASVPIKQEPGVAPVPTTASSVVYTPEEVSAAARGIAALNLESPQALLHSLHGLVNSANTSGTGSTEAGVKRHNNLRRSQEAMAQADMLNVTNQTKRNRKQVIYSSGVVNRGLVEDQTLYPAHTQADRVTEYNGTMDVVPHTRRAYPGTGTHRAATQDELDLEREQEQEEESGFTDARAYHWPASHAFDYNVQSYSKVVLTQGQALLDPSLSLHKNPFAWAREMYHGAKYAGSAEHTAFATEDPEKESQFEPTITEADEGEGMDVDSSSAENHSNPIVKTMPVVTMPLVDTSATATSSESNAVVPVYTTTSAALDSTVAKAALPALPYFAHGEEEEVNGLHKLLSDSNFMTLKLPASSIRVGKSWSNSKEGTVESLMDVFNISKNGQQEGMYDEASVEINCIILGAKLVVSQATQA